MKFLFCLAAGIVLVTLIPSGYSAKIVEIDEDGAEPQEVTTPGVVDDDDIPDWLDWRLVPGRVGPVKEMDTEKCPNGYWAFAVTGLLEGQQINRNVSSDGEEVVTLSEQQLLDCIPRPHADGCDYGWPDGGLQQIGRMGGIESDKTYPYNPPESECKFNSSASVMSARGFKELNLFPDEDKLKRAVATHGPLIVLIYRTENFDKYKSGVFIDDYCPDRQSNTPLLLVGYGTDPKEGDYWILKTPYGVNWGEFGYMRFARNRENMCSITNAAGIASF